MPNNTDILLSILLLFKSYIFDAPSAPLVLQIYFHLPCLLIKDLKGTCFPPKSFRVTLAIRAMSIYCEMGERMSLTRPRGQMTREMDNITS